MTGDDLARKVQARCDAQVAEAVAAERARIAGQLHALLADPFALRRWVAHHGLVDAGRGATLDAVAGDVLGVCSACRGLGEFVGGAAGGAEPARECPARPAESPQGQRGRPEPLGNGVSGRHGDPGAVSDANPSKPEPSENADLEES